MNSYEIVNVHEAKTHLSRLLERAHAGEEIILAKAGKPYARLMPLAPDGGRRGGQLPDLHAPKRAGPHTRTSPAATRPQPVVGPEFFEPLPEEELRAWEGR